MLTRHMSRAVATPCSPHVQDVMPHLDLVLQVKIKNPPIK